jgi:hypothetical protein
MIYRDLREGDALSSIIHYHYCAFILAAAFTMDREPFPAVANVVAG